MNRALRAATMGVLLLSPIALSACSAGQVTQTNAQDRDKTGATAQVGDISVRAATLAYPEDGVFTKDQDAELRLTIVNFGDESDALVGISGEGFGDVEFFEGPAPEASSTPSATATPTAPATEATSSAAATSSVPAEDTLEEIEIPADSVVNVDGTTVTVLLTDLKAPLTGIKGADETKPFTPGLSIELTLTFQNAGEVTLPVTVATPTEALDREKAFDFHNGEEAVRED